MPWEEVLTPKVVVNCAILDEEGRILLVKRKDNGLWALPGGFMERGERVREAVLREVREETGLEVEIVRMTGVYSDPADALYGRLGPEYQVVVLVFRGRVIGGEFEENEETYGFRYFEVDALPPLVESHRQRILDAMQGAADVFIR